MIKIPDQRIDEILLDLSYAIEDYNTKFGKDMLINSIKKLKKLKNDYPLQPIKRTMKNIGSGGSILTETYHIDA